MSHFAVGNYHLGHISFSLPTEWDIDVSLLHEITPSRESSYQHAVVDSLKHKNFTIWHPVENLKFKTAVALKTDRFEIIENRSFAILENGCSWEVSMIKANDVLSKQNILFVAASLGHSHPTNFFTDAEKLIKKIDSVAECDFCILGVYWKKAFHNSKYHLLPFQNAGFELVEKEEGDAQEANMILVRSNRSLKDRITSLAYSTIQCKCEPLIASAPDKSLAKFSLSLEKSYLRSFIDQVVENRQTIETGVLAAACVIGSGYLAFKRS
jgi:hypothetical protein